jgi:hypothetical protein
LPEAQSPSAAQVVRQAVPVLLQLKLPQGTGAGAGGQLPAPLQLTAAVCEPALQAGARHCEVG